jgi:predicted PurR-regulated permease PerM
MKREIPFYVKASLFFMGAFAFISMLYIGRTIILPLLFSLIIAIVLHPVVNVLTRLRINRVVAIIITLVLTIFVIVDFGSFLFSQVTRFSDTWPVANDAKRQSMEKGSLAKK